MDDQRNHGERAKSTLLLFLAVTDPLVGEQVVGHGRSPVADSAPGHAEASAVLARGKLDDPEQALLGTAERGRHYLFPPRIDDADPCQPKLTGFARDPAGFAKQLLAIPYPHDRGVDAGEDRVHAGESPDLFFLLDMVERKG